MADDKTQNDASSDTGETKSKSGVDRRKFLGTVTAGAGAAAVATTIITKSKSAEAEVLFPQKRGTFGGGGSEHGGVYRSENELFDCEVEGKLPADLDGIFFRVGPDPQYPKPESHQNDISFDGEGHVSAFHIKDGHVDYKTRYARTQRWKAQHKARRSLFGMYRNPMTDDPSVKGLSRGTANTQQFFHHGKLLVLKEDSPPVVMDPYTLETTDDYYLFGGKYPSQTHTAHPKIDSDTGDLISFGYEAKGFATDDIYVFQADAKDGHIKWDAWVKAPYIGMIHDFAATDKHIIFLACPLAINMAQMKAGGVHWAWDSSMPTLIGVMHRGGDGKDIRWFKGPQTMCTHVMGCWSDGEKITMDMDGGAGNQFAFFPNVHNDFDPKKAFGNVRRFKIDFANKAKDTYDMEIMYPEVGIALSRQDDRYHTKPYRWGFAMAYAPQGGWAIFDQQKQTSKVFSLANARLAEPSFVPRNKNAGEGDGYLIGVATYPMENNRADLVLLDLQNYDAGAIAKVKMPYPIVGQIHGFWTPGHELPPMKA